jgi:hypothetical protein
MYAKAYRWSGEMEEIAAFVSEDEPAAEIYRAAARLYERLAEEAGQEEIAALRAFLEAS